MIYTCITRIRHKCCIPTRRIYHINANRGLPNQNVRTRWLKLVFALLKNVCMRRLSGCSLCCPTWQIGCRSNIRLAKVMIKYISRSTIDLDLHGTQRAYGVFTASHQRRCKVTTFHRCWCDIVSTLRVNCLYCKLYWRTTKKTDSDMSTLTLGLVWCLQQLLFEQSNTKASMQHENTPI